MNNSYFVTDATHYSFFDGKDVDDTERAFDLARAAGDTVVVYSVPKYAGPWDRVAIVGHRLRGEVLREMGKVSDKTRLELELGALDERYRSAGRTSVPTMAVAA